MKNITAVEWLVNQINHGGLVTKKDFNKMVEKAKQMEKEQIRIIYDGLLQNVGTSIRQEDLPTFEEYFKHTYEK